MKIIAAALLAAVLGLSVAPSAASAAEAPWFEQHRALVERVEPFYVTERSGKLEHKRLRGAVIHLRPQPGVTAEWLQRSVDDHFRAMNSPMPGCPLAVPTTKAVVRSTGSGFQVTVAGDSKEAGEEILRRARTLR
jgi:hypothetical protein